MKKCGNKHVNGGVLSRSMYIEITLKNYYTRNVYADKFSVWY